MKHFTMKKTEKRKCSALEIAALGVMALGILLLGAALALESGGYPWGILFGTASQDENADPDPLVLDGEDAGASVVFEDPSSIDETETAESTLPGDEAATAAAEQAKKYVVIGTFKIPVLRISQNLLEGVGKQLKYGVGHMPGTAAPGDKGNCVLAGHRSHPFRHLNKLKTGDSIILKAGGATFTYKVFESFDVLPEETWVLNKIDGEDYGLTIITCTPYIVSSHRLIVRARLADIDGLTPEEYYRPEPEISEETPETPEVPEAPPQVPDASAQPPSTPVTTPNAGGIPEGLFPQSPDNSPETQSEGLPQGVQPTQDEALSRNAPPEEPPPAAE